MDLFGAVATAITDKFEGNAVLVAALGGSSGRYKLRMFNRRAPEIEENRDKANQFPYVVFFITDAEREDTLSERGKVVNVQFNIYDYDEDSPDNDATLNDIYDKLNNLYNETSLSVSGYHHIYTIEGIVIPVPTTDDTLQITVNYEVMVQSSSSSSSSASSSSSSSSSSG
jgi:hypothetical protein